MVDITEISAMVAAAGVLIGVVYYIIDMRNQNKMRQMDFIMRMPSSFVGKEVFETLATVAKTEYKNYDDFEKKCGIEARQVGGFCEDLGLLVKGKIIDIDLVAQRYEVSDIFEKLKPWIMESRKRANSPTLYEWFEYLYNELRKRKGGVSG